MRPHPLLVAILSALPGCAETMVVDGCVTVPEDMTSCAPPNEVSTDDLFFPSHCRSEFEIVGVTGEGKRLAQSGATGAPACCYPVEVIDEDPSSQCVPGRPYFDGGLARLTEVRLDGLGLGCDAALVSPQRDRAKAWAAAGAAEHASVAAFNRLSLQLMALGAPLELIRDVQRAALDEVHHAEACWGFAARLSDSTVTLGSFPFAGAVDPNVELSELAYDAVREGCLAETLGAAVLHDAARLCSDETTREVLQRLASDEMQHAVLSFRIVAWALAVGGKPVRAAVEDALKKPWPGIDLDELSLRSQVERSALVRAHADVVQRVLRPATTALLTRHGDGIGADSTGSMVV